MIEGVLIVVAALLISAHAWDVWNNPRPIGSPFEGIGLNAGATALTACGRRCCCVLAGG